MTSASILVSRFVDLMLHQSQSMISDYLKHTEYQSSNLNLTSDTFTDLLLVWVTFTFIKAMF